MKNNFLILLVSMLLFSCSKDDTDDCDAEAFLCNFSQDKTILKNYNTEFERYEYPVSDGTNNVFEYNHSGAQCDYIMDDEWGELLTFEINKDLDVFEYEDNEILLTNCFYQEYGAWVSHIQSPISKGILKGEKISKNVWKISATITVFPEFYTAPKEIKFIGIFK